MKTLILDAGNTRITCAVWEGKQQRPVLVAGSRIELAPPVPLHELAPLSHPSDGEGSGPFRASFEQIHAEAGSPPVVMVSVVPRIEEFLPGGIDLEVVDHTSALPFVLDVEDPSQVGPDRLCNVTTAVAAGLTRALVVDAGTATTFDLLIDGVFVGGMIAPGMAFAARQLGATAARLDPVPFGPFSWDVGRDTRSAMAAGAWHAGVGGVRAVVEGICARYGKVPVVVTGGLGFHFDDSDWYFDPHWTLRGAAILSSR